MPQKNSILRFVLKIQNNNMREVNTKVSTVQFAEVYPCSLCRRYYGYNLMMYHIWWLTVLWYSLYPKTLKGPLCNVKYIDYIQWISIKSQRQVHCASCVKKKKLVKVLSMALISHLFTELPSGEQEKQANFSHSSTLLELIFLE